MTSDVDALLMFANAATTFICGGTIAYLIHRKKLTKHYLFVFWSIGFFLYGIEITMRALLKLEIFPFHVNLLGALIMFAFILFPIGLWTLSHRKHIMYMLMVLVIIMVSLYAFLLLKILPQELAYHIYPLFLYLPVTATLLDHRYVFGKSLDRITIGWLLLFTASIFLPVDFWFLDVAAIFSKGLILLGMIDYEFVILVKNIRNGLAPSLPSPDSGYRKEGRLKLIKCQSDHSYQGKAEWIRKEIMKENDERTSAYIFCFQDTIPYQTLRSLKWIDPDKVFIFLFSTSAEDANKEFTVLPMGITEIGAALSEVFKKHVNSEEGCKVFFTNLSVLIHAFGVYPCYNMLLNKIGELRAAGVELFICIHPGTHNDKTVVPLFTNISDEVTEL